MYYDKIANCLVPGNEVSYDKDHMGFRERMLGPKDAHRADVVLVGVPFDGGTFRHVGTNEGPLGIRKGLDYFRTYSTEEELDIVDYLTVADVGNVDVYWNDYHRTFARVDQVVGPVLKNGQFPLVLGGDHSITYQLLKTACEVTGKRLGVIWFDNHLDSMDSYHEDDLYCGTPLMNLDRHLGDHIAMKNVVHIGSRGFHNSRAMWENARRLGAKFVKAQEVKLRGIQAVVEEALEVAMDGTDALYLTLDIDVADAVYAPGTQCPRPGGLDPHELCWAVRRIAEEKPLGFDIMEVAPPADVADVTQMLAASLVLECLTGLSKHKIASGK